MSCNELLRYDRMPVTGRNEQRGPMLVLVEGLRVLCRQNRTNLRGVTIIHCLGKLIPRHIFPTPSLLLKFIHLQLYGPSVHPTPHTNFQTRTGDMSWYQQGNECILL